MEPYYAKEYPEWVPIRTKCKEILQTEDDLTEIVQLVGKDSLAESDKLILEIAKVIKDDYLAQNGFSKHDAKCPFYKAFWMMKNIITYYNLAKKAIEDSTPERKMTWLKISDQCGSLYTK